MLLKQRWRLHFFRGYKVSARLCWSCLQQESDITDNNAKKIKQCLFLSGRQLI